MDDRFKSGGGVEDAENRPEPADAKLLAALFAGRQEAYWDLWGRYQNSLRQVCLQEMRGHMADAEDALSQVMLRALDRLPACAEKIRHPEAWLHRLARNLCTDLRRKQRRQSAMIESWESTSFAETGHGQPPPADPESNVRQRIAALPPLLREAFVLQIIQEIPVKDVASQLKISAANVRKRVQLARAWLRRDLTSSENKKPGPTSAADLKPAATPAKWLPPPSAAPKISPSVTVIRTVRVKLPCGVEHLFHVFPAKVPVSPVRKIQSLRGYLRQQPGNWEKRLELAELLQITGDWKNALGEWQGVLGRQPHLPTARKLGDMLLKFGEPDAAGAVFKRAREQPFQSAAALRHWGGWIAFCENNADRSVREFQAAGDLEPENPVHWHGLALAHRRAGMLPAALTALNRALALNPGDPVALSLGQAIWLAAGHIGEAIRRAQQLLQLAPQDLLTLRQLVECRCRWGLIEGAAGVETKRLLRRAARLSPDPSLMRAPLAEFFRAQGEPEKALAVHRQFVEQHPQCPRGWRNYQQLLALIGGADRGRPESHVWKLPTVKCCNGACRWHENAGSPGV